MFDQILSKIQTVEDKEKLLEELDILLSSLYEDNGLGFKSALKNKVRAWVTELISEQLEDESIDKESFLLNLKQKIESLETVDISCAFEPTDEALNRFGSLIRRYLGKYILLRISYDPHLIGGVQIVYKGQFRDFSFKRIFEQEFEKTRPELLKSINIE